MKFSCFYFPVLPFLCLFIPFAVCGQSYEVKIKGQIVDSVSLVPIPYVTLTFAGDKFTVQKLSGADGAINVVFDRSTITLKKVVLSSSGYEPKTIAAPAAPGIGSSEWDLGKIGLKRQVKDLKEVVITGVQPLVKQQLDRLTYDVQNDVESKAASTLEIMRKVPLVQVEMNGEISVNGKKTYLVLLNGKPYALYKNNPTEALRSLKANLVKEIQVVTTPPSRYITQGYTDVINIITLSKKLEGFQGSVNFNASTLNHYEGSAVINKQWSKIGLTTLLNGVYDDLKKYETNTTVLSGTGLNEKISQSGFNDVDYSVLMALQEISYSIDSVNLLLVSASYTRNPYNNVLSTNIVQGNGSTTAEQLLKSSLDKKSQKFIGEFYFQNEGKKNRDKVFTMGYRLEKPTVNEITSSLISGQNGSGFEGNLFLNGLGHLEHQVNINYSLPVKKITVEAGARAVFRDKYSNGELNRYDPQTGLYVRDDEYNSHLDYSQNVLAVYNSYYYQYKNFGAKLLLNYERTEMKSSSTVLQEAVFNNLLPLVDLQLKTKKGRFNFKYEQSISRPSIQELNNFLDFSNPNLVTIGNPNLIPASNHAFVLTYGTGKRHYFKFDLSYSTINNSIEAVSMSNGPDTVNTTFQNIGKDQLATFRFNGSLRATKKLNINLNSYINYAIKEGAGSNMSLIKNDGFQFGFNSSISFLMKKGWNLYSDMKFISPKIRLQEKGFWWIDNSVGASKRMFKNKGNILLVVYNPFQGYRNMKGIIDNTVFYRQSNTFMPIRKIDLRFNYNFGKLKQPLKKPGLRIENNDLDGKEL
ncbi:MAG: hypothetical protein DI535_09990 [Citrobacter freundii]|nr:MAG: hypothetical protein DI535_09990 [Citrobacter freundii]